MRDRSGQLAQANYAPDMRELGLRATQRLLGARLHQADAHLVQLACYLDALGNVARDFGEADQLAAVILECVDHDVGQEAAAVLAHAPGFGLVPAIAGGDFERLLRHIRSTVLLDVKAREVLADDLFGAVALDALCAPGSSWSRCHPDRACRSRSR